MRLLYYKVDEDESDTEDEEVNRLTVLSRRGYSMNGDNYEEEREGGGIVNLVLNRSELFL